MKKEIFVKIVSVKGNMIQNNYTRVQSFEILKKGILINDTYIKNLSILYFSKIDNIEKYIINIDTIEPTNN